MNYFISVFVRFRPRIIQFFGFLGTLAGMTMFAYENTFVLYPTTPDEASHRTVAYVVKYNLVRYVTPSEAFIAHLSHPVLFTCMGVFGFLMYFEIKKKRNSEKLF